MKEYLIIEKDQLVEIADSIRKINDSKEPILLSEMDNAIEAITEKSTIKNEDVPIGEIGYGKGGKLIGLSPIKHIGGNGIAGFPASRKWHTIAYGNGRFVCIVNGSTIAAHSTDGIIWEEVTLPVSEGWTGCCFGNGMFIAIANNTANYIYSYDGIEWTKGTLPAKPYWNMSAYGAGKFVIIGYNSNIFAYSEDGINWTKGTLPRKGYWCSMTYADGVFLAVPYGETGGLRSVDGVNWEQITLPSATGWNTVCGFDGRIAVICDDTVVGAYTEDKGTTWIEMEVPSQKIWYHSVVANGRAVCVAESSNTILHSDDLITWYEHPLGSTEAWCSVAYGNGKYVTCGRKSNKVSYSFDGENWTTTENKYVAEITTFPQEGVWLKYGNFEPQKLIVTEEGLAFETAT